MSNYPDFRDDPPGDSEGAHMSQDKPVLDRAKELMTCFYLSQGFMEAPEWDNLGCDFQEGFLGLAALERQGSGKWVPLEPTKEMVIAGAVEDGIDCSHDSSQTYEVYDAADLAARAYRAMLVAIPQAQDAQTGEGKDGDLAITESLLDDGHASGSPDVAALIEYLREQTFRTRGKKAYMLQEAATAILALQHQLTHTRERLKEALDGWVSSEHEAESELFLGRIEAIRKEEGL